MNYLSEYQEAWLEDFQEIAEFLEPFLGPDPRIHHVGSTSIPGMPAKDIIDVNIQCSLGSMAQVVVQLADAGYEHRGNQGIATREAFRPQCGSAASHLRPHHLYACEANSPELRRHLAFRDYLRAHPERASWLAKQKLSVDSSATSREAYINNKATSYETVILEALR